MDQSNATTPTFTPPTVPQEPIPSDPHDRRRASNGLALDGPYLEYSVEVSYVYNSGKIQLRRRECRLQRSPDLAAFWTKVVAFSITKAGSPPKVPTQFPMIPNGVGCGCDSFTGPANWRVLRQRDLYVTGTYTISSPLL